MKILLIRVAKGGNDWADQPIKKWVQRMRNRWKIEEIVIRPAPEKSTLIQRQQSESQHVLRRLQPTDRLIVLDERGEQWSTEQFSAHVQGAMNQSTKRLVFAIGGPFGHAPELRKKAWKVLQLSSMVLNHELARMVLVEQLYRAYGLIWGGKYHH